MSITIAPGSTAPFSIGPIVQYSGSPITTGTSLTGKIYINAGGSDVAAGGTASTTDANGYAFYTPAAADFPVGNANYKLKVIGASGQGLGYWLDVATTGIMRSSQIAGITGTLANMMTGTTDESTLLNNAITALSAAGGGTLLIDGFHCLKHPLNLMTAVIVQGVDSQTRLRYYGSLASGGTDDYCLMNNTIAAGWPETNNVSMTNNGVTLTWPVRLKSPISSTSATTCTLQTNQGTLFTKFPCYIRIRTVSSGVPPQGRYDGELCQVTGKTGDQLTIVRGAGAQTHVTSSVISLAIVDDTITIRNLTIDCNSTSYSGNVATSGDGSSPSAATLIGIRRLTLDRVTLLNTPGFGFAIGNIGELNMPQCRSSSIMSNGGDDGIHIWGPVDSGVIDSPVISNQDNCLAFAWGELESNGSLSWLEGAGNIGLITVLNPNLSANLGSVPLSIFGSPNTTANVVIRGGVMGSSQPVHPLLIDQNNNGVVAWTNVWQTYMGRLEIHDAEVTAENSPIVPWSGIADYIELDKISINPAAIFNPGSGDVVVACYPSASIGVLKLTRIGWVGHDELLANGGTIKAYICDDSFATAAYNSTHNYTAKLGSACNIAPVNTVSVGGGGGLTAQQTRDALDLTATAGGASIDAQLAAISATVMSTPIVVNNPVNASGELDLDCGDDYPASRPIQFGVPAGFMSLIGSTPQLDIAQLVGGVPAAAPVVTIAGQVLTGSWTINGVVYATILQFTLTAAQTAMLTSWSPNSYVYRVRAVWTTPTPQTITIVAPSPCTALW